MQTTFTRKFLAVTKKLYKKKLFHSPMTSMDMPSSSKNPSNFVVSEIS